MLTMVLMAASLAAGGMLAPQSSQPVRVITATPAPVPVSDAADGAEAPETRRVCRYQRATGSNFQQRVCRDVPRAGFQDGQTREFLRVFQRIRLPDNNATHRPTGPAG